MLHKTFLKLMPHQKITFTPEDFPSHQMTCHHIRGPTHHVRGPSHHIRVSTVYESSSLNQSTTPYHIRVPPLHQSIPMTTESSNQSLLITVALPHHIYAPITLSPLHIKALPFDSCSQAEGRRWSRSGGGKLLSSPECWEWPCIPPAMDQHHALPWCKATNTIAMNDAMCPALECH